MEVGKSFEKRMSKLRWQNEEGHSPFVPHPGFDPETISLNPVEAIEYIKGLMNPRDENPLDRRKSFNSEKIAAAVYSGVAWYR